MAIQLLPIVLGILADRVLRKQIRKWLDVRSFDKEKNDLILAVIKARQDGKITKEESREIFRCAKKAGIAFLLDKIK